MITSSNPRFHLRNELPPIISVLHKYLEASAYQNASSIVSALPYSDLGSSGSWKDFVQSSANTIIKSFSSMDIYDNFAFGRKLHLMYKDYTEVFNKHKLNE